MALTELNHVTVRTTRMEATRDFYVTVLGMSVGSRPDLGFPGAWLYASGQAVLHIIARRPLPESP